MFRFRVLLAALAAGMAGHAPAWAQAADLVLYNGQVLTVDRDFSIRKAVAVKDGRILAVGGDEIARQFQAPVRIDLKGRTLMPGFMDNHLHPMMRSPRAVEVSDAKSIAEIQARVRAKAAQLGPGEWITGYGWAETNLAERRNVVRADLDAAAPGNPVALSRAGGHSIVGNSLALKAAGITRGTPDPLRGVIEKDEKGEPNGIIRERIDLYGALVPPDTQQTLRPSLIAALKALPPLGLTSIMIAAASIGDEVKEELRPEQPATQLTFRMLRSVYDELGAELPRSAVAIGYPGAKALAAYPHKTGYGDERLRLGPIGEAPAVDGGFSGPTAWTTAEYKDMPGFRGQAFFNDEADLQRLADDVAKNGWQLGLHAIGDAAINQAVKVYAQALRKYPKQDHRWYLAHFTMLPTDATLDLMAKEKILAAAQPNFLYTLESRYVQTLEGKDLQHNNPVAVPAKRGVFVTFGSDNLPIDPRVGLYAAVTRRGSTGAQYGPEEAVSIQEAIRMYTANPAHLTWEEGKKGTLEAGKLADMIVLDIDPLTADPKKLLTMNIDLTIIGGKVVHDRAAAGKRQ
jgi:predicted amidohydrolase YtcJ